MNKQELRAGGLVAKPGEKVQGFMTVTGTDYQMPATLVNGTGEGKTILLTAGIHGGEYPCIQAAIELGRELQPEKVKGQIIIVHIVNPPAFNARLSYINPLDEKNINRLFPGDPKGTISQQIAWFITQELQGQADFYVDMHGGDIHEELPPYAYYPGVASAEVVAASRAVVVKLDVDFIVKSSATTGAYNSAAIRGLPCILMERGSSGLWSPREVELYKKDLLTVLGVQGLIEGYDSVPDKESMEITKAVYLDSTCSGCWYPAVKVKETVKKGQKIGEIRDFFGEVLETFYADFDSIILFVTSSLAIGQGDAIITYGI